MQLIVISQCEFQLNPRVFLEHLQDVPQECSPHKTFTFLLRILTSGFWLTLTFVSNGWGGLAAGGWRGHSMVSLIYVVSTSVNFDHLLHLGIAFKLDLASFYA